MLVNLSNTKYKQKNLYMYKNHVLGMIINLNVKKKNSILYWRTLKNG